MSGRQVPWSNWEEWDDVRIGLNSHITQEVYKALDRVQAWRCRGRLPLGVDITATLVAIQLQDAALCRSGRFHGPTGPFLSENSLQSEYSMSIVRLVNGVSDSSQKGRVAVSVARQAEAAGLPALLVTVRHEATHNHMPSIHFLHVASGHALDWLKNRYWAGQESHLQACRTSIMDTVTRVWTVQASRLVKARASQKKPDLLNTMYDEEYEDEPATTGPQPEAPDLNKQRKALLGELKRIIPEAYAPHLASTLVHYGTCIQSPPTPPVQPNKKRARTPTKSTPPEPPLLSDNSQVLDMLDRHYPTLTVHTVHTAISCACANFATITQLARTAFRSSTEQMHSVSVTTRVTALKSATWWVEVALRKEAQSRIETREAQHGHAAAYLLCLTDALKVAGCHQAKCDHVQEWKICEECMGRIVGALVAAIGVLGSEKQAKKAARMVEHHTLKLQDSESTQPCSSPTSTKSPKSESPCKLQQSPSPDDQNKTTKRTRFSVASSWTACPLGTLPTGIPWLGRLPELSAPEALGGGCAVDTSTDGAVHAVLSATLASRVGIEVECLDGSVGDGATRDVGVDDDAMEEVAMQGVLEALIAVGDGGESGDEGLCVDEVEGAGLPGPPPTMWAKNSLLALSDTLAQS